MESILSYFAQLNAIPRASFKLDAIRSFLEKWATDHGANYRRDTYGNVVIYNTEDDSKQNIIIQSHMDMVTTKTQESTHNFDTDPIINLTKVTEQGQKIMYADGTTLGADNGIGLCASLVSL